MRIAITTFFQSQTNYGQLLQAFAMQQSLMQLGHFPYTIRYGFHEPLAPIHGLERIQPNFSKLLSNMPVQVAEAGTEDNRHFDDFRSQHMNLSQNAYNTVDELRHYPPVADCYLTGSDQVWAQLLCHENNATFYLDFGCPEVLRISYAPSFALNAYPEEQNSLLAEHLKRFDAISTREKTGVEICKKAGREATWVVDPTMLLNGEYYRQLAAESVTPLPDDYAFVYHVNIKKDDLPCWSLFRQYNTANGLPALAVHANGEGQPKDEVEFLSGDATYLYPTIQDWIRLIDGSRYVLTTSFHGMLFAIMLHKPFFVSLRPQSMFAGNDRITDILAELGLTGRIVTPETDVAAMLQQSIDWEAVDRKMGALREHSLGFLKHSLEKEVAGDLDSRTIECMFQYAYLRESKMRESAVELQHELDIVKAHESELQKQTIELHEENEKRKAQTEDLLQQVNRLSKKNRKHLMFIRILVLGLILTCLLFLFASL